MIPGFSFSGMHAGIKRNPHKKDLGLILIEPQAQVAALTTQNKFIAACVRDLRDKTDQPNAIKGILVNSGNANALTGKAGLKDIQRLMQDLGAELSCQSEQCLSLSTGIIGRRLPAEKIKTSLTKLILASSPEPGAFAESILTTDLQPKIASRTLNIGSKTITITGIAKGSGMIQPNMATMLAFICTDATLDYVEAKNLLKEATDRSFNRITVDSDTSTNDSILLISSQRSLLPESKKTEFARCLTEVCEDLAKAIIDDGEGATKTITISVRHAISPIEAKNIFFAIANSPLVKTAFFGEQANVGRILAAAGKIPSSLDPLKVDLMIENILLVDKGTLIEAALVELAPKLKQTKLSVVLDLNQGKAEFTGWTCDLSLDYIRINADYT